MKRLEKRHMLTEKGTESVLTLIEGKIKSAATNIRWYLEENLKTRQNALFLNNQNYLYKELSGKTATVYSKN